MTFLQSKLWIIKNVLFAQSTKEATLKVLADCIGHSTKREQSPVYEGGLAPHTITTLSALISLRMNPCFM